MRRLAIGHNEVEYRSFVAEGTRTNTVRRWIGADPARIWRSVADCVRGSSAKRKSHEWAADEVYGFVYRTFKVEAGGFIVKWLFPKRYSWKKSEGEDDFEMHVYLLCTRRILRNLRKRYVAWHSKEYRVWRCDTWGLRRVQIRCRERHELVCGAMWQLAA